jgi:hypothetical protein
MNYELIRSRRKSIGAQIRDGRLTVRAPWHVTEAEIERFLRAHESWIDTHLARERELADVPRLTRDELQALAKRAKEVIPQRVAYFAPLVGAGYGRITIRSQRTRWGSCSAQGNLSFNCLLMLAPPEVLDGVVVHELCHRLEPNHSKRFYAEVLRVLPDYRAREKWLKENGGSLLARLRE